MTPEEIALVMFIVRSAGGFLFMYLFYRIIIKLIDTFQ